MARTSRSEWSQELTERGARRSGDGHRWPGSTLTFHVDRPLAQLQPGEKKRPDPKEELFDPSKPPSSGRTTALGRRVEKPGRGRQSGPSGQRDGTQHDRQHANK